MRRGAGGCGNTLLQNQSSQYYYRFFLSETHMAVIYDPDSESHVRIENRRTVTQIRSPEILPQRAPLTDSGQFWVLILNPLSEFKNPPPFRRSSPCNTLLYFNYTSTCLSREQHTYMHTYLYRRIHTYISTCNCIHGHVPYTFLYCTCPVHQRTMDDLIRIMHY